MGFGVLGIALMGVDLMMTRNFFTHIGELMAASILCFVMAIVLDRTPVTAEKSTAKKNSPKGAKQGKTV